MAYSCKAGFSFRVIRVNGISLRVIPSVLGIINRRPKFFPYSNINKTCGRVQKIKFVAKLKEKYNKNDKSKTRMFAKIGFLDTSPRRKLIKTKEQHVPIYNFHHHPVYFAFGGKQKITLRPVGLVTHIYLQSNHKIGNVKLDFDIRTRLRYDSALIDDLMLERHLNIGKGVKAIKFEGGPVNFNRIDKIGLTLNLEEGCEKINIIYVTLNVLRITEGQPLVVFTN